MIGIQLPCNFKWQLRENLQAHCLAALQINALYRISRNCFFWKSSKLWVTKIRIRYNSISCLAAESGWWIMMWFFVKVTSCAPKNGHDKLPLRIRPVPFQFKGSFEVESIDLRLVFVSLFLCWSSPSYFCRSIFGIWTQQEWFLLEKSWLFWVCCTFFSLGLLPLGALCHFAAGDPVVCHLCYWQCVGEGLVR